MLKAPSIRTTFIAFFLLFIACIGSADNYYWIGGSGNWSDINHWAQSSGGTVLQVQIPTSADNVFFDENSFSQPGQTVYVNTENAICKSMDWSSAQFNPIFAGTTDNNLRVFGSLSFIEEMSQFFMGTITFESATPGNTIYSAGNPFLNQINFNGIGGEWTLLDNLTVESNIILTNGSFITDGKTIESANFYSNVDNNRMIDITDSEVYVSSWSVFGNNLQLLADNSHIFAELSINNQNGSDLHYHNVSTNYVNSTVSAANIQAHFHHIYMNGPSGKVIGTNHAQYIRFSSGNSLLKGGNIVDSVDFITLGTVQLQNQVQYVHFFGQGNIIENNDIGFAQFDQYGSVMIDNTVDTLIFNKAGKLKEENIVTHVRFGSTGIVSENNTIGTLQFNADGYFFRENSIDTLNLSPGFRYFFPDNKTTTVNQHLDMNGTCQAPIFLKSNYNGVQATIDLISSQQVQGAYLSIRDLQITGSNPVIASNSVDLGNNSNWQIETHAAKDLYWVGGPGNWDDQQHWSLTSGGAPGECPPTELDNAIFDQNSQLSNGEVSINVKNAVCNDFDWSLAASTGFTGKDTCFLVCYGNFTLNNSAGNNFLGETHFEAIDPNQSITIAGNPFLNTIRFQGINGSWNMQDKLIVNDSIVLFIGGFNTNNNPIDCEQFSVIDTNYRELFLHQDTITITNSQYMGEGWFLNSRNLLLDADSSVIVIIDGNAAHVGDSTVVYNNMHLTTDIPNSLFVTNDCYANFNLLTLDGGVTTTVQENCTIDTLIQTSLYAKTLGSDTIRAAFYNCEFNGILNGNHVIEIAIVEADTLFIEGNNQIDTTYIDAISQVIGNNTIDTSLMVLNANLYGHNHIHKANFISNADFNGTNSFDDIYCKPQKKYRFQADSVTTIYNQIHAKGFCTGPVFIESTIEGKQAIISNQGVGTISVDFSNITDIHATGNNLPFQATNSFDLGNNSNWDIQQPESIALYWVGNSGNWSDSLHWAPVSGGQGGYCIPSPLDDVYFDENSFTEPSSVEIDIEFATCHNMDWTGALFNPSLTGDIEHSLSIYGSLILNEEMNQNFAGEYHFRTIEANHTIASKNQSFKGFVHFNGRFGEWSLADGFTSLDSIYFKYGSLFTEGHPMDVNLFYSLDTTVRTLDLDTSSLVFNTWDIVADNLEYLPTQAVFRNKQLLRTSGWDDDITIQYGDIFLENEAATIINDTVYCRYDDIYSYADIGSIVGDCTIDSAFFYEAGSISGSDTINHIHFLGGSSGSLHGGEHIINTVIFEPPGTISGNCQISQALFHSSGNISGFNVIDTTIIYGNGNIIGDNILNKTVHIFGDGNIQGHNVFNNNLTIEGTAYIFEENTIQNTLLNGWGYLGGPNVYHDLTLTPGNTYTLTALTTQTVNGELDIRGNNCFPITLKSSSTQNVQANIYKPDGEVSGDFIVMKDIAATGSASFFAGGHSDDISNNSGWIWDDAPGYIYGLGEDLQYVCEGDTLVLSTENFNGNPNTIYQWDDGSTSPEYFVTQPGTYNVEVIYSDDCSVPDQIEVEGLPSPDLELGPNQEICEGATFSVDPNPDFTTYLWSTAETTPGITIENPGSYWLEVSNDEGCISRDTINLDVLPAPEVNLGADQIIHNDEFVVLDAGYPGASFYWSTGETTQQIQASGIEGGLEYWVEVLYKGCTGTDTIFIDEYPFCTAILPTAFSPNNDLINDTLACFTSGVSKFDLKIFNRYGDVVFKTNNPFNGWNGLVNGQQQETDVFLYFLKAVCMDGYIIERKGNVTLLK